MKNEDTRQEEESSLEANIRKLDLIFMPTSFIRTMRGNNKSLERTGKEPVHYVDRTISYVQALFFEALRLGAYAIPFV